MESFANPIWEDHLVMINEIKIKNLIKTRHISERTQQIMILFSGGNIWGDKEDMKIWLRRE